MATKFRTPPHWTLKQRLEHYTDKSAGPAACWPWKSEIIWNGYGRLTRKGVHELAHRLSWQSANAKPIPKGLQVLHKCDNRRCVNPSHLFLGTARDNVLDCVQKKRRASMVGSANNWADINETIARRIKRWLKRKPPSDVARRLNVSVFIVYSIKYGYTWKHV